MTLSSTRALPFLAVLITLLGVAAATLVLDHTEQSRLNQQVRAGVLQQLSTVRARLEGGINSRVHLGRGLVAAVSNHPDIGTVEFDNLARVLLSHQDGIRSLQLARGNVISHIYPLQGNEAVLHLDLEKRPDQREVLQRIMNTKETVVAGPVRLVQGGTALIVRTPVFLSPPGQVPESGRYWGVVSTLIEPEALLREAGIVPASGDLEFAVRGTDGMGSSGALISGDSVLFERDPVVLDALMPNGSWQIAGIPKGGWPAPDTGWIRAGGTLLALISALLVWLLARSPARLRMLVDKAVSRLRASEQKFRDITETIPLAVFISRQTDGEILFANERFDPLLGLPPGTAVGRKTSEFYSERSRLVAAVERDGMLKNFETRVNRVDGSVLWCAVSLRPIVFNEIPAYLVALLDITERKRDEDHIQALNDDLEIRVRERTEALVLSNQNLLAEVMERQAAQEALRGEHEFSEALLQAQSDVEEGVLVIEGEQIIYANPAISRLTGYPIEEIIGGMSFLQLAHPDVRADIAAKHQRRLAGETVESHYETAFLTVAGERREVEVSIATHMAGDKLRTVVVGRDITERKHAEDRLRVYQAAIDAAADSIVITSKQAIIEYVNPAFTRNTGYTLEEAKGKSPRLLKSGQHNPEYYRELWEALLAGGEWKGVMINRRKNGELYHEEMAIAPVKDNAGEILRFVAVKRDVTERMQLEQRLDRMAHYDGLTELPNRTLFFDRLDQVLAQAKRHNHLFALLFVDLDGFKSINDTFGHEVGDILLREVAKRIGGCVRESDTVARMGGDEFTIILTSLTQPDGAAQVAQKIIEALYEPVFAGSLEGSVGASIGITLYPDNGADRETLLSRADAAMYRAKEQGKNTFRYYS